MVIWALHILMWYPPSSDFINNLPYGIAGLYLVATPLGLFLIGFGILLIVWSGAGLSSIVQTASTLQHDEEERAEGMASVRACCPHCNAAYFYRLPDTESDRTVTCQNCNRRFEVVA